MSRVIVISPSASLVGEVVRHLRSSGHDYSDNVVVFPGKRPAHFLRKAIGEKTGGSFIPPRIFSADSLIDCAYESLPGPKTSNLDPLDAAAVLYDLHRTEPERIGADHFADFELFLPLGLRIFSELEELALTCLPEERIRSELSGVSLRGLHVLGSLYRKFYAEVERLGYSTRAMRYVRVANSFDSSFLTSPSRIVLAGFFALTQAERKLIQQLLDLEQTVLVFQHGRGLEQKLQEMHLHPEGKPGEASRPEIMLYSASDLHGEVFGLSARLAEAVTKGDKLDHHTLIVVPHPDALPPVIHQALALIPDGCYNISLGYPHVRTPVFGFLRALMDLVSSTYEGRFSAPEYMKFVLHPYTKNILLDGSAAVTRVLFHTIEEFFVDRKLPAFFTLEEIEGGSQLFNRAAAIAAERSIDARRLPEHLRSIHDQTVRAFLEASTIGDLARRSIEVLSYIADHSTASRHPLFRPYVESLIETLDSVQRSMLSMKTFADRAVLVRVLRNCLVHGEVPFHGTPLQGVQVLGFLETRNLQFDRVYFLNVNDDVVPGTTKQYTLIPNQTRNALGLPTYRDQDRIAAYYFDVLLKGAKEVHLFFTENDEKEASRFVEELLWERQQAAGEKRRDRLVTKIPYRIKLSHEKPQPIGKTAAIVEEVKRMTFSATQLDTYLKCGLRFYYAYLLRLEEKGEVEGDIDRLGLGSFVHDVLKEFFAPFIDKPLTDGSLDSRRMEEIVDRLFVEQFGGEEIGNKYLLKVQTKKQLTAYLEGYEAPRLQVTPVTLLALEQPYQIEHDGWQFRGTIDRVEDRAGTIAILDYKIASDDARYRVRFDKLDPGDRSTWSKAIGSLQLPIYVLLYAAAQKCDIAGISPAFLILGKNEIDKRIESPLFEKHKSAGEMMSRLEFVIFGLLEELADPALPFVATDNLDEECPRCPFTGLCRTQWVRGKERT